MSVESRVGKGSVFSFKLCFTVATLDEVREAHKKRFGEKALLSASSSDNLMQDGQSINGSLSRRANIMSKTQTITEQQFNKNEEHLIHAKSSTPPFHVRSSTNTSISQIDGHSNKNEYMTNHPPATLNSQAEFHPSSELESSTCIDGNRTDKPKISTSHDTDDSHIAPEKSLEANTSSSPSQSNEDHDVKVIPLSSINISPGQHIESKSCSSTRSPVVLVVDDNAINRKLLTKMIDSLPFSVRVEQSANGQEAVDYVRSHPEAPDLPIVIFMDISMVRARSIMIESL